MPRIDRSAGRSSSGRSPRRRALRLHHRDGEGGGARVTVQRFTARNLTFPALIAPSPGAPVRSNQRNSVSAMPSAVAPLIRSSSPPRAFGNFVLGRLLGKSELTMVWLALDTRTGIETLLSMPRLPPSGAVAHRQLASRRRGARRGWTIRTSPRSPSAASTITGRSSPSTARVGVTLDEWLAQHPPPSPEDAAAWVAGVLRGLAFGTTPASPTSTCSCTTSSINERGQASVMALAVAAPTRPTARVAAPRSRDGTAAPLSRRPCARNAPPPSATCSPAACPASPARRRAGARAAATSRRDRAHGAARSRARSPALDARRTRSPSRCARSPIAAPRRRCACAIATRARSSARSPAGSRRPPTTKAGRSALLLDRLRSVGHLPALPGLATRVGSASPRSRASAPTRSHATCCPTWRCRFELLRTLQLGARAGNADRRQRPGADPAPRRRADRRRRRSRGREQPARLAGPARRRRGARAAPDDRSRPPRRPCRAVAAPGRLRRRGGVPGRGAAKPRPAAPALPLRRRGRADPTS